MKRLTERVIIMKGAGEMATGVACRLHRSGFRRILMLETPSPLAVRREVSFCEAIHNGRKSVEGIEAVRIENGSALADAWEKGKIPLLADPQGDAVRSMEPDILIDATIAKRNLGIAITDAPLVIALGPGFFAGRDCHLVIETNRGHNLGRLIACGEAEPNTGIPGNIGGYTRERVLRAPADGHFTTEKMIGDQVSKGDVVGLVGTHTVTASIDGVLRGLIRPGTPVTAGLKIGDIDPRGDTAYCHTISEKARALGGSVLEAILTVYNQ
ncbi:selenium-dependent molybdenum cofactor biosynthesis protein YqeB [Geobacter grbiciae]|uniref:selenium-dependent molybdenum cofactor biosynthesis protein YqeB n=1 Tax=Geobacter grbiciae TaxID=155042 RepID=UPI001C034B34|nr:selenium-dependent molybdenum cofactor biosynthesis protein YqeB [Geobacter grbiciae]MBT1076489.1 EF2563 family selenium-dependent molybdenum hydroxylase system protein [Geobacter grbiciae]